MQTIDPTAAMKFQSELSSGESIYWAGMPNPSVIFHSDDWTLIPFSLFWAAFSVFWEASVLGYLGNTPRHSSPSLFMAIWGIPIIVIGQYLVWGRFLVDAWVKRRTYYAVTNRRVLFLQEAWKRKTNFAFLETIPETTREGGTTGTIWLGAKLPVLGSRGSLRRSPSRFSIGQSVPVLADIDDVNSVHRLILDLREQARKQPSPAA